ncbi:MAG: competence/damage-inducible protein A [Limnochordaceae bacterium]|nr:competence/damage-inducible protein A [Limnochordaceae bacterium]
MRAEIVTIGTELLLGQIVDTNAAYLARTLSAVGYDAHFRQTVGDNYQRAVEAVSLALGRSDVVLVSGGLGPTEDDVTREVVAGAAGVPLELSAEALDQVEAYFRRLGREMLASQRRQALVPRGSRVIPNPVGTAPGFAWEGDGRAIIALPGVPAELEAMTRSWVVPYLQERARRAGQSGVILSRVLRVTGPGEAAVEQALQDLLHGRSNPTVATYAGTGEVHVRITARAPDEEAARALLAPVEREALRRLRDAVYGFDDQTLESVVVDLLRRASARLAVAESCTGGLVGDRLTNVPGVSECLVEDLVVYSNEAKMRHLGVDARILSEHGAVSEPCALAMARGVAARAAADLGLAITGIAGPGGGTPTKPVGLVYLAVAGRGGTRVERHVFGGDRIQVKRRSAQAALDLLRRFLLEAS